MSEEPEAQAQHGQPAPDSAASAGPDPHGELKERIVEVMKTVFDPEIPVNIYELGMVYDIEIDDEANATVTMTLTSPACPVVESLPGEVEVKLNSVEGVKVGKVNLVWEPPWTPERMSEAAKLQLGMM